MPRKSTWPPKIHHRQDRNTDFCIIDGRRITLGEHGSAEARQMYSRLVLEAETHGGKILPRGIANVSVAEVALAFVIHAQAYYHDDRQKNRVKKAVEKLVELYGTSEAASFGGPELRVLVRAWIKDDLARTTINGLTGLIRKLFAWAAGERLVPPEIAAALYLCPNLRKHHSEARETDPVEPADMAAVERTLPHLLPQVRAMVRLQLHTGMRPGEVVLLRPADINRAWMVVDGVPIWLFSLERHKTAWRGAPRHIPIGPRAQAVLLPYLERAPEMYCFSPREAVREHYRSLGRRLNERGKRAPGEVYTTMAYDHAVMRVCRRHKIEPAWSPNQLRHRAATDAEVQHGREKAQALLGHSNPTTTAIYAERTEKAARLAALDG